ncbi:MAG: aminotransferase class I/II-fold pyridoxal phosphate-dependent enzyme [Gemmatimonadales bacterium]|nr:aminotransferase class I/II-fold pyridoxal phosphate-dependent enzyme [Gemmatimonadales bacterium]NIN13088.1 aminotransferase class I/II-fold pyridoxal phosphate-dependent enzyme [Gemmatimonadales bacterium]NIN51172.1 aminotransferase class I/II-fold pyridoxal phosphate-dependent enzyme [Gemmatimonadales bacterium]NIP08636.1 aminotransferase class I/II-fold pyridoxal phosphate-dependent enzyme [Gemmatimonadales bacterium]NIR02324.1 aminotransferase class I/II-fold pyridoxal phosphate-depende
MATESAQPAFKPSRNLEHLKPSATIAVSLEAQRRKAAGEDVIDLSAGEPDFDTPRIPAEAGIKAIQQGMTHYPANPGILELRAAAARHLSLLSGGRSVNADHIVVSTGAKQCLFNACFALFGPGDRVLIPSPAWVSYPHMVHFARATPVLVPGDVEWSLKVGVEDLEKASDQRAAGLILCSPVNPTGAVYTRAELKAILEWARQRELWVITDEVYRRIHYGSGPAPSALDQPDELLDRVVIVTGVSKTYAMTGWRIGFTVAPLPVAKAMAAIQSHVTSGASHPAQWAAATALSDERVEADVTRMVEAFRHRRDFVVSYFRERLPGVEFVEPLGAFYFFFRVDGFFSEKLSGATDYCGRLLAEQGVALVPGEAFGDHRWVRLSYAASEKDLEQAVARIAEFARSLETVGGK